MGDETNGQSDPDYFKKSMGLWIILSFMVSFWIFSKFAKTRRQLRENLHVIEGGLKRMQKDIDSQNEKSIDYVDDVEDISYFMKQFREAGDLQKVSPSIFLVSKHSTSRRFCVTECPILTDETNDKAVITLNRPNVHNCVNKQLALSLYDSLKKFENKSLVIIKGAGESYCSGGDLKWILQDFKSKKGEGQKMMMYHNVSIHTIATYPAPSVALIDGITMGGGVGYSKFCKYQVATEKTKLAMPESLIGFHPNSGASYFFTRMRGRLGWYLALTGRTLNGSDVVKAGFATHYCRSDRLKDLEQEILKSSSSEVEDVLDTFSDQNLPEFSLRNEIDNIDECFSASSVEEIFTKLEQIGSKETLELLKQLSPTSLKVIFRQLQKGEKMSLKECLNMEYSLTNNFLYFHDFPEGIRTKLIAKGEKPRWSFSSLSEVPEGIINKHFETQPSEELQRKILEPMRDLL